MTLVIENPSRALRLKMLTRETHEILDNSIMAAASFQSVDGYAAFAAIQYLFHREIDALYSDNALLAALPGLAERRSSPLIAADLADLGKALPDADGKPQFSEDQEADLPTALGWLYVAEGSNMGAALLRKEAAKLGLSDSFGARHLAPAPEGPAAHWRQFTASLDAVNLSPEEDERVVAGAQAAFQCMQHLANARLG